MKLITYDYLEKRYSGVLDNSGEIFAFQDLGIPYPTLDSLVQKGDMHVVEEIRSKVAQRYSESSLRRLSDCRQIPSASECN